MTKKQFIEENLIMSRQRTIQYAIDQETGQVVSRVHLEFAWPILDFAGMNPVSGFQMEYNLEKLGHVPWESLGYLVWTRKIPNKIKNIHRVFWGMKPLKGKNRWE